MNGYQNNNPKPKLQKVGTITERTIQKRDGTTFTKLSLKIGEKYYILRENTYPPEYPGSVLLFNVFEDDYVPQPKATAPAPAFGNTPSQHFGAPTPSPMNANYPAAPTGPAQPVFGGGQVHGFSTFGKPKF